MRSSRRGQVRKRYPALPRGERKLTNLLQLGDLLEQESARAGSPRPGSPTFWLNGSPPRTKATARSISSFSKPTAKRLR